MSFLCIEITSNSKANYSTVTDVNDCSGFIAQTAERYQATPTLYDLFTIPLESDLQAMFMLGFGLPVIAYLASWSFGVLINWFNEPDQY